MDEKKVLMGKNETSERITDERELQKEASTHSRQGDSCLTLMRLCTAVLFESIDVETTESGSSGIHVGRMRWPESQGGLKAQMWQEK